MEVVLISIYLLYVAGRDYVHFDELLEMTSGERKCWNVTILDDSINEIDVKWFSPILFRQYSSVIRHHVSTRVHITDNDQGM